MSSPFAEASPTEIPLSRAPLVKVLTQLKFPVNARIDTTEGIVGFQEALRESYPVMRQEQPQLAIALPIGGGPTPGIQMAAASGSLWRLTTSEGDWAVVLAKDFLAIETSRYTSRDDFLHRFAEVLGALVQAGLSPSVSDRLGVRYIDRIEGEEMLRDLALLVRPEVLGVGDVELPERSEIVASASQTQLHIEGMEIRAGWGILPPNAVLLPGIDGVNAKSWVLDVDVYAERVRPFSVEGVVDEAGAAADHAYRFFRWVVTDEFLRRHGGAV